MTSNKLLEAIHDLTKKKRRRAIKIHEIVDYAQTLEKTDKDEIWMLIRSLEKKAYIKLIHAQNAGILGVSITPLGETMVKSG